MSEQSRREFIQISAGALAVGLSPARAGFGNGAAFQDGSRNGVQKAPTIAGNEGKKPLRLGLIIHVGKDPDAATAKVQDIGLPTAQVFVDDFDSGFGQRLRQALDKHGIEATSLVVGGPGKEVW